VKVSQVMTIILMICSAIVSFYMESIANAWKFLMALGAGTGLVYILRWFWWRINAWSEVSAMLSAFVISLVLEFGFNLRSDNAYDFAHLVLLTAGGTTIVWLIVTFLTKPEPKRFWCLSIAGETVGKNVGSDRCHSHGCYSAEG